MTNPPPSEGTSAARGTAGKARVGTEFFLALLSSSAWYFVIGTRYGTRDPEALRAAVAGRIPGETVLWLTASVFWIVLGARMKPRPVLAGVIAVCLFMARDLWSDLAFVYRW